MENDHQQIIAILKSLGLDPFLDPKKINQKQKELLEKHLKSVDSSDLSQRIKRFRNLNFKNMSNEVICDEIDNVL